MFVNHFLIVIKHSLLCILFSILFASCHAEGIEPTTTTATIENVITTPMNVEYSVPGSWQLEECAVVERAEFTQEYCDYVVWKFPSYAWVTAERYQNEGAAKQALSSLQHFILYDIQSGILSGTFQESELKICESTAYTYQYIELPGGYIENNSQAISVLFVHEATLYKFEFLMDMIETKDPNLEIDRFWQTIEGLECP